MNLSVDPSLVAFYNGSPETQLSKYGVTDTTCIQGRKGQKSATRGLTGRTYRLRGRGKGQNQNSQSQSVKPKSSWRLQSLTHFASAMRERPAKGNGSSSISSWDDSSNSFGSLVNDTSLAHSQRQDFLIAPAALHDIDDWDAVAVESDDECESCRSDGSSVVAWEPLQIERQKVVPVEDRELNDSDCSTLTTIPVSSAKLFADVVAHENSLPQHSAMSKKSKYTTLGSRRIGIILTGAGKSKREELSVNMAMSDTFLVYQARAQC